MNRTRSILAARHLPVLRTFARSHVLLAFDYDGTLSPIAPTPDRARLPVRTRTRLGQVATLYPATVISGRALADIAARVAGLGIRQIFGNHGLESSAGSSRPYPQVRRWLTPLHDRLSGERGVMIEDKVHSVSVHFRAAPDHDRALQAILPVVRSLPGARVIHGAAALNLLPEDGANKGAALRRAFETSGCDRAIYVGDDNTDEDAFAALSPDVLLAIRVGPSRASCARYHLEAQSSIDALLETLIEMRS